MKKKFVKMLCLVLAVSALLTTAAMASTPDEAITVRVNGAEVVFPDGQPFIDSADRTMIPVRFVTEQLGADVGWDGATQTAIIRKGDTTVSIRIGSCELTATHGGETRTITMDTAAVLKDNRTYVPIRYVAESLGASVDYSDKFRTVGIYDDKLTAEQIAKLQSYAYTQPEGALGYDEAANYYSADTLNFLYGDRSGFDSFANAREHLYHTMQRSGDHAFSALGKTVSIADTDSYYEHIVAEAVADAGASAAGGGRSERQALGSNLLVQARKGAEGA